ncbi:MAG: major capsid protein [Thiohalospira sp.]
MADLFETRTMLRMLEQMKPPKTFLRDMFFPQVRRSSGAKVDVDIRKGQRRLAPLVHPRHEGHKVESLGYTSQTIEPAYVKPKVGLDADEVVSIRNAGENPYTGESPAQRLAARVGEELADLDDTITRREEWMAAKALDAGEIVLSGEGIDVTVSFGRSSSHNVSLSGTDAWDDADSDPEGDLRGWKRDIQQATGRNATDVVMGADAFDAFLTNEEIKEKMDTRRVDLGEIRPEEVPDGATYVGHLRSAGLDLWTYDEWYVDPESGDEEPMIPAKKVWVISRRASNIRHYGAIRDLQSLVPVERFPKSWETEDPSMRWMMVQSAPLLVTHEPDAVISAQVLE